MSREQRSLSLRTIALFFGFFAGMSMVVAGLVVDAPLLNVTGAVVCAVALYDGVTVRRAVS